MRILACVPAVLFVVLNASPAWACTCVQTNLSVREQVEQEFRQASVIFEGKVEAIETKRITDALGSFDRRVVTLRVWHIYKGPGDNTFVVHTGTSDADCGFHFKLKKNYVVYAYRDASGQLSTNICTRTRRTWRAVADVKYLEELAKQAGKEKKH